MTKERKCPSITAILSDVLYCGSCGWPIVSCCVNNEMIKLFPTSDWIIYCSNKGCFNHKGEDYNQGTVNGWVKWK
jgi:hypothetical protein